MKTHWSKGTGVRMLASNFILLSFLFFSLSCDHSIDPTYFNSGFRGITHTTDSPLPIGEIDHDDWKADIEWNYPVLPCQDNSTPAKISLLQSFNIVPLPYRVEYYPCYPNPTDGSTSFTVGLPYNSRAYLAIIDQDFNTVSVLLCDEPLHAGYYAILWMPPSNLPRGIYRSILQLKYLDTGEIEFQSHGDIWLK